MTQTAVHHPLDREEPTVPRPEPDRADAQDLATPTAAGDDDIIIIIPTTASRGPWVSPPREHSEEALKVAMCDPIGGGGCIPPGTLGAEAGIGVNINVDSGSLFGGDGVDVLLA